MSDHEETRAMLVAAKERLRRNWIKGRFHTRGAARFPDTCGVCAVGALKWVAMGQFSARGWAHAPSITELAAQQALSKACGTSIVRFNDDPSTKKEDVLRVFDLAIADLTD